MGSPDGEFITHLRKSLKDGTGVLLVAQLHDRQDEKVESRRHVVFVGYLFEHTCVMVERGEF